MAVSVSLPNENDLKQQLSQLNPFLCPDKLSQFFPEYNKFSRDRDRFGIWHTPNIKRKIRDHKGKHSKVLLLLSGVAGGGKDAIREKITQVFPSSIFKIITATSRQPREGEQHAVDYYFYDSTPNFKKAIDNNELLEWVPQGSRLYGLPKVSLTDALARPEPIIATHVEMTAWPKVAKFIEQDVVNKPFILKVFVMPHMRYNKYANDWLTGQRQDYDARMSRTLWELDKAPQTADLLISNHIDTYTPFLEWQTRSLIRLIREVLTTETKNQFSACSG
ncbi:MAG: hypothetical protein HN846_01390 [Candidatus Pacebacteria bacterium]|jgi:guanylate kinase|nr:hypothetical protein [Candidatus Paceibacterota bacterium]MBT3511674.1 hypothetical protein [Candidatus Paceibacterota bacterium]MBT4004634.1 hypothetical protein [Candidatus Paceibacterota bacterium]MBT4359153.1 hypothetical protein [Candidatus Paceibacterota bacterium]MBT4681400.1 hypothetical protein [Candidatus Paceibacterota bacterium]